MWVWSNSVTQPIAQLLSFFWCGITDDVLKRTPGYRVDSLAISYQSTIHEVRVERPATPPEFPTGHSHFRFLVTPHKQGTFAAV